MTCLMLPFVLLWTLSAAKHYRDYYKPLNITRAIPSGIAAYRSALTLDWLAAEDYRQRELVAAIESEPLPVPKQSNADCIDYARPSAGGVARLMLELLKNLEGDDGNLVPELVQSLVRTRLLSFETSMFDSEPDFEALIKTPKVMMGEPHSTFPRIVETLWMAVTDPSTVKKHGWCTVHRMSLFLATSRPSDIAKHMRNVDAIVTRARYIMEEFIQQVTPLNILKPSTTTAITTKGRNFLGRLQPEMRLITPSRYKHVPIEPRPIQITTIRTTISTTQKELIIQKRDQRVTFIENQQQFEPSSENYEYTRNRNPRRKQPEKQDNMYFDQDNSDANMHSDDFMTGPVLSISSRPDISFHLFFTVIIVLVV